MHLARTQALSLAGLLSLSLAAPSLIGCGAAATPGSSTAHDETVVAVAPVASAAPVARVAPIDDPPQVPFVLGVEGVSDMTDEIVADGDSTPSGARRTGEAGRMGGVSGGVVGGSVAGGSVGGVLGGLGLGSGGLGLSGVGLGGGGSGIGLGLGGGRSSTYRDDSIPGTSIDVDSTSTVEYGDSATLGISLEAATRALRNRLYKLRDCYDMALDADPRAAGAVSLRMVVKLDGYLKYVNVYDSTLARPAAEKCLRAALLGTYVGMPQVGQIGIIETTLTFRPTKR